LQWKSKNEKDDVLKAKEQMRAEKRISAQIITSREGAKSAGGDIMDPGDSKKTVERTVTTTVKAP
ncbi:hypothetical protein KIN20_013980, partial [Parelaphostrongylus tenuis]